MIITSDEIATAKSMDDIWICCFEFAPGGIWRKIGMTTYVIEVTDFKYGLRSDL